MALLKGRNLATALLFITDPKIAAKQYGKSFICKLGQGEV